MQHQKGNENKSSSDGLSKHCSAMFKYLVILIHVAIATAQVVTFTNSYQTFVDLRSHSKDVFREIFYNGSVPSSFYEKADVYSQINYIREQFTKFDNTTIGVYGYSRAAKPKKFPCNSTDPDIRDDSVCIKVVEYSLFRVDLNNNTLETNLGYQPHLHFLLKPWNDSEKLEAMDKHLPLLNGTSYVIDFDKLVTLEVYLGVRTVLISSHSANAVDCYNITFTITFHNKAHTGKTDHSVNQAEPILTSCPNKKVYTKNKILTIAAVVLYSLCVLGTVMFVSVRCCRGKKKQQSQGNENGANSTVGAIWIVQFLSNICLIAGSVFDLKDQNRSEGYTNYDVSSMLLGIGCLLAYLTLLEICKDIFKKFSFSFFQILSSSFTMVWGEIFQFIIISSIIFIGFWFCGWVVLSPYHPKFKNIRLSSEALFSLINGDDMFGTFSAMPQDNLAVFIFSRIFFAVFISIFAYLILNVFLTIIIHVYEAARNKHKQENPRKEEEAAAGTSNDGSLNVEMRERQRGNPDVTTASSSNPAFQES